MTKKKTQTELEEKNALLERIRSELKLDFFGIDGCIDRIIDSVKTWYLLPEILTRPTIINLWGLTGVGKTALVRSLIKKLGFTHHFVEIQMDSFARRWESSIHSVLESSSIKEGCPGIIFLDEFQRFRTKDEEGKELRGTTFQDVWQLLSDGKFSSDYSLLSMLEDEFARMEYNRDSKDEPATDVSTVAAPTKKKEKKYLLTPWEARQLRKMLRLQMTTTEIMMLAPEDVMSLIEQCKLGENNAIDYTKCLIFVAGNLDEAFNSASDVEDCDTSADAFCEHSQKIGVSEIKSALTKRFKPEQIARFGNNHIVYPSLSEAAYMSIIRRECDRCVNDIQAKTKIKFSIDQNVYDEIYANAVYPMQGTRPVFTTIHGIFSTPLPDAVRWAIMNGYRRIRIDIDTKKHCVIFRSGKEELKVHVDLDIRTRRARRSEDFNALIAVHEAGHALAYSLLFKRSPIEAAINATSYRKGYTLYVTDIESTSKQEILDWIVCGYGGMIAEEIIFGQPTFGNAGDMRYVTTQAAHYVRKNGMGRFNSVVSIEPSYSCNTLVDDSSADMEHVLSIQRARAESILKENKSTLLALARELVNKKKIVKGDLYDFLKPFVGDLRPCEDKDVNYDYSKQLNAA